MSVKEPTKIFFSLPEDAGIRAESLQAMPIKARRYRVLNIPFYVREVSLDDEVECERRDGHEWFVRRVKRSGNGTIRVFCAPGFGSGSGAEIVAELGRRGMLYEILNSLVAANIPKTMTDDDLDELESFLKARASEDCFYEIPDV